MYKYSNRKVAVSRIFLLIFWVGLDLETGRAADTTKRPSSRGFSRRRRKNRRDIAAADHVGCLNVCANSRSEHAGGNENSPARHRRVGNGEPVSSAGNRHGFSRPSPVLPTNYFDLVVRHREGVITIAIQLDINAVSVTGSVFSSERKCGRHI